MIEVHVSDLVEYFTFLQVNHTCAYRTLSMDASAVCSILQAMEQMRASKAPFIKKLHEDVYRKNPPPRVCAETWDIKNVIELTFFEKTFRTNYTKLMLKMVMILAFTAVKRPPNLNLLGIILGAMQVT